MAKEPLTPFQSRLKAGTFVITSVAAFALLLHDWGPNNVFSGVRPAVKAALNRAYGIEPRQKQPRKEDL